MVDIMQPSAHTHNQISSRVKGQTLRTVFSHYDETLQVFCGGWQQEWQHTLCFCFLLFRWLWMLIFGKISYAKKKERNDTMEMLKMSGNSVADLYAALKMRSDCLRDQAC